MSLCQPKHCHVMIVGFLQTSQVQADGDEVRAIEFVSYAFLKRVEIDCFQEMSIMFMLSDMLL